MLKLKRSRPDEGFSLIEVLVAMLLTTFFVTATMQAVVIATLFKVKSQENTQATNRIQKDIEQVKNKAHNLQFPQGRLASNANLAASLVTVSGSGESVLANFSANSKIRIGTESTTYKITAVTVSGSNKILTITPPLTKAQVQNAAVTSLKMCSATSTTTGLAQELQNKLSAVDSSITIKGKSFTLSRSVNISNNSPYNVLQLTYQVADSSGNEAPIAKFYLEVMPNVAFQCP